MIKKILIVLGIILIALLAFFAWSGLFTGMPIQEETVGPYRLCYQTQQGNYGQTPKTIESVMKIVSEKGITGVDPYGIYYDNPDEVETENLRAEIGILLEPADFEKAALLEGTGLQIKDFPEQLVLKTELPKKSFLSFMIGSMRVYPKFAEQLEAKGMKGTFGIERYSEKRIIYMMGLED
jgi:hypothetical protein